MIPLPQNCHEIVLGFPKDQNDLSRGFDASSEVKDSQCVKSLGLKDSFIMVFAFLPEGKDVEGDLFKVELPDLDVLYGENA